MCLSLCACGGGDQNPEEQPTEIKEEIWVRISDDSINDKGTVIIRTENVYNEDGELARRGSGLYKNKLYDDDFVDCTYEYELDEQNNLTEMRVFENNTLYDVYTFNRDGYITEITSYYGDGRQSDHQLFEYDEAGRLVTSIDYMDSGELDYKILYKYREDGTCEEHSCYEEDDVLLYITECDELGRPYFTKYYNAKAPTYSYKYVYDDNGNLTEVFQYFGNSNDEQSHYRYTYRLIQVTPLQKKIIEAKNKLSAY
jgi:hypothetical protein